MRLTQVMAIPFHWCYEEIVFFSARKKRVIKKLKSTQISVLWSLIPFTQ